MNLSRAQADAELAAIDGVVRQLKQSRIYRASGDVMIVWGLLQFAQYGLYSVAPQALARGWVGFDAIGVALTVWMLRRAGVAAGARLLRVLAAFALFYGFGFAWSTLGDFGAREAATFWRTLFLFGYCLAGLWFGAGFLALGLGLTAACLAVYAFAGPWFWPLIALASGLSYIACGLWMRRA